MKGRRGFAELPATTIFMIAAGSLIILFFVVFALRSAEQAKGETEARSLQLLDTLLKTAVAARDTASNVTIVSDTVLYKCDDVGMRFGFESNNELELFDLVVFSPPQLAGGQVNAFSRGEDVPYRGFNVLYLTTPKFIIANSTDLFDPPPNIETVRYIPPNSVPAGRRVVIGPADIGAMQSGLQALPRDMLIIRPGPAGTEYGTVQFVAPNIPSNTPPVVYPSYALLHGALLSKDPKTYYCVFDRYLDQLKHITTLQRERVSLLKDQALTDGSRCYAEYHLPAFDKILALPDAQAFSDDDAQTLQDAIREIAFTNERVLAGDRCAAIY